MSDTLHSAFDYVIDTRGGYFSDNPEKLPDVVGIEGMINSYARNNAAISGGASLIPGPLGMAAILPELTLVIKNQVQMVYDIGVAHGKQAQITKELLIGIFVTAAGTSAGGVIAVHGGRILVKRASLRVIQKVVAMLGGRITQQALKSALSKWIPFAGAAAMAYWSNYMTKSIGKKADELFRMDIKDDPDTLDIEIE
ncbi:hypothetical protein EII20_12550 [Comamonadaceae bacterium OH2545_COT-014]|nr:hypothetical protein EII20_12550 [Comamonadaceae bacterium OH2545_COT-014]